MYVIYTAQASLKHNSNGVLMKLIKNSMVIAVGLTIALAACSPTKTPSEYLESAKVSIEKNDHSQAIIELKNAIKGDPKNSKARELLGTIYLNQGAAVLAEKELKKAIDLDASIPLVLVKLLKSLNMQEKNSEIIKLSKFYLNDTDNLQPEGMLYIALAHSRLGNQEDAGDVIDIATDISTNSIYSKFGEVYLRSEKEDVVSAINILDQILGGNESFTLGYLLKGQLHFVNSDYKNAIIAFNEYYKQLPQDHKIRLFLANTYFKLKQYKEVKEHITFLLKISPDHAFSHQLLGAVYLDEGNNELASRHSIKAIQNGIDTNFNNTIAGLSSFHLENYEMSHHYLAKVVESLDNTHVINRVFAFVQLKLSLVDEASDTILSFGDVLPVDSKLFAELSSELIKGGEVEAARTIVNKMNSKGSISQEDAVKMGILKLSLGDLSNRVDLERSLNLNSNDPLTRAALATSYIQSNQLDKAMKLATEWQVNTPDITDGFNLAAEVNLLKGNVENAELLLNKALSIDKNNVYSLMYFAKKHLVNNEPEDALTKLNMVLDTNPNHLTALSVHYKANKQLNHTEDSVKLIFTRFSNNNDSFALRLLYARVLFDEEEYRQVVELLAVSERTKAIAPPFYWLLLGESLYKLNDPINASEAYRYWAEVMPKNKLAWLKHISSLDVITKYSDAMKATKNALKNFEDDGQLITLLAYYQVINKKIDAARLSYSRLSNGEKNTPLAIGVQGQIWFFENKFDKAYPNLIKIYEEQPSLRHLHLVNMTLLKLNQNDKAMKFLIDHVQKHPNDVTAKNYLAETAMRTNLKLAQTHLAELIIMSPESAVFYNNFAWVEYELGNYNKAKELSLRANELIKDNPSLIDTLAMIEFKLGNRKNALDLLEKAVSLAPSNTEIINHLEMVRTVD
jgi:putative PEP-CTERM system TPR-repeat lipoprotein